jgi:sugar phosphate isomerase/epimerase
MNRLRLGVRLASLNVPLRQALAAASRIGVAGVEVDAVGDLAPKSLSATGRREFRNLLRTHNVELTALACPLRRGLDTSEDQQPRLEHVQQVMALSYDLGPRLTIVQAGAVPARDDGSRGAVLSESLTFLSGHGDRTGTTLALDTGLDSGSALRAFLDQFDTGSLGANFDPANLLINGFNVFDSLRALQGKIVHMHARDARRSGSSKALQEVPVGAGDIDWISYLAVLEEIEYRGWLVVERESGENRMADVTAGVQFLRRLLP